MSTLQAWAQDVKCADDKDTTSAGILIDRLAGIFGLEKRDYDADILSLLETGFTEEASEKACKRDVHD